MKKLCLAGLVALLILAFAPASRGDGSALALVRVHTHSAAETAYLMSNFDETHNHSDGEVELLLWPGDRALLDAQGFHYEVVTEDLYAHDMQQAATASSERVALPGPDRTDYRRLGDYETEMRDLADKNPNLVKLFEMPNPSLEGRTVLGLELASGVAETRRDGRPIFYIDGLHHAREWPAAEYVMVFAHYLVEGFGKDPQITKLLRSSRVIVVPIVNVDGFDYSRESVLSVHPTVAQLTSSTAGGNGFEGYWRKNRRSLTGATIPVAQKNPDAYGVDPNRNYGYLWGDGQGGSSGSQISQTYRGEAPFSEPETQNVRKIILNRQVTGVLTNHTYQGSVLRTGGGKAPEDAILSRIADEMAAILGYENRASVGYPTTGTTDDWAYAAIGSLGFTIEHGTLGFHPPYAQSVGADTDKTMEAFMVMAEVAADPRYHAVLAGKVAGGGPARLTLTKSFATPLSDGNPVGKKSIREKVKIVLETAKDGSFEWHVGPSTRPYAQATESYSLKITAGGKTRRLDVSVRRGQRLDLGTIRL